MITVSIVTYNNTFESVKDCITNFLDYENIKQIIICENTEISILDKESIENISFKVKYISNEINSGYGAGHNLAISMLDNIEKYHVVMNLDVFSKGDVFKELYRFMQLESDVALAMPKVLNSDGSTQRLCKMLPTPINLFFRRFLNNSRYTRHIDRKYTIQEFEYNYILDCPYLSGCFMFLRRSSFDKVNGFDERFFMYPEDIDLTRRLHELGRTVCYPFTSVSHAHGQASYKSRKMLFVHIKGMIRYFNKWGWIIDTKRRDANRKLLDRLCSEKK